MRRVLLSVIILSLLFLSTNPCLCQIEPTQPSTLQGWQIENDHGYCSESNGVFRLWSDGGYNWSVALYKEIKPTDDFTFIYQVKAEKLDATGLLIKRSLPIAGQIDGFNFEYGHYGDGLFLLARNFPFFPDWMYTSIAHGDPHYWYTMKLTVSDEPFRISTSVFYENGTLMGSYSTSDITNFTFDDVKYIGIVAWGGNPADASFRIIQDPFGKPSSVSISTETSSITAGSAVNVFGTLTDDNGLPLANRTVVLSYTFPEANSWIPISSDPTDERGEYVIQWINSASGTFTLKTEWSGDSTHTGTSNTTTLSFLPYQNQQVFVFESNSTVTALAFNNETSTLSFNVTGQSGTTGFVRATIAKSLLASGESLLVYLDGKQLNYTVASGFNSWVFVLNYTHSTHQISLYLPSNIQSTEQFGSGVILIIIIAVFGTILAIEIRSWFKQKDTQSNTN